MDIYLIRYIPESYFNESTLCGIKLVNLKYGRATQSLHI